MIHKTAIIDSKALIGNNVKINHGAIIKHNCKIGDGSKIESNSVISNSILEENIYIGSNSALGQRGFGFSLSNNKNIKIFLAGGANDPCISNGNGIDGLYHFLKKRFKNVNMKKFQQMRHEIQNESCKDELLLSIESYLNS